MLRRRKYPSKVRRTSNEEYYDETDEMSEGRILVDGLCLKAGVNPNWHTTVTLFPPWIVRSERKMYLAIASRWYRSPCLDGV